MVADALGYQKPPSSCCGAAICSFETPTARGILCSGCERVIRETPKVSATVRFGTETEKGVVIFTPPMPIVVGSITLE